MNDHCAAATLLSTLPIVAHHAINIDPGVRENIAALSRKLLTDEPLLAAIEPFGPQVRTGVGPWPSLLIEDHSWIALFGQEDEVGYSYRPMLLAREGDLVVIDGPRNPDFEAYCRDALGLGAVEIVGPGRRAPQQSLAIACANGDELIEHAAARAQAGGGLNVIAYMGTGGVWQLAGRIATQAGVDVQVASPPPRLTRRVNDKLWFARRIEELFGRRSMPSTVPVFGLAALTARTLLLAKHGASVAIKLTDSAGGAGIVVVNQHDAIDVHSRVLRDKLFDMLSGSGWRGTYPLLVTEWERPVIASPSVQLWIPEKETGDVLIEGIFDQMLAGEAGRFCGAIPTHLSAISQQRLSVEAVQLGFLFQALGYFGRCSFDAILVGEDETHAELHWIECNGRWGGTSIPMTLANRLVGDWQRYPFVLVDHKVLGNTPRSFAAILDDLADDLFIRNERSVGVVFLSPERIEAGTGCQLMVIDETIEKAMTRTQSVMTRFPGS